MDGGRTAQAPQYNTGAMLGGTPGANQLSPNSVNTAQRSAFGGGYYSPRSQSPYGAQRQLYYQSQPQFSVQRQPQQGGLASQFNPQQQWQRYSGQSGQIPGAISNQLSLMSPDDTDEQRGQVMQQMAQWYNPEFMRWYQGGMQGPRPMPQDAAQQGRGGYGATQAAPAQPQGYGGQQGPSLGMTQTAPGRYQFLSGTQGIDRVYRLPDTGEGTIANPGMQPPAQPPEGGGQINWGQMGQQPPAFYPQYPGFPNYSPYPAIGSGQPSGTMFSGTTGPQAGAIGRPPEGWGVVPPLSPAMTQVYGQFLMDALQRGGLPTYPGQMNAGGNGYLDMLNGMLGQSFANPQNLRQEYGPWTQMAGRFANTGLGGGAGDNTLMQMLGWGAYGPGSQVMSGFAQGNAPGLPGEYLNNAIQFGGQGFPAQMQNMTAQGAPGGVGGGTLQQMAATGQPIDQLPQWQRMIEAQQRGIDQGAAQIRERLGAAGNLMGTPYNTALTDYYSQTARDQNALLGGMTNQALEAARGRQMGASGQLTGLQQGALESLAGRQQQAGMFTSGQQYNAAQELQNRIAQIAAMLSGNQMQGINMGSNILGQSQTIPYGIGAGQLGQLFGMGQWQHGIDQQALNRLYQEFLRTQPEYNPLLGQMGQFALTFPGMVSTQFPNSVLGTALGQGIGSIPWGSIFGGGQVGGTPTYAGNGNIYGGLPQRP